MSAVEVIVLKKSFWGDERKFLEPLMRFARGGMRDHIVSHKNDHGASYRRYGVLPWRIGCTPLCGLHAESFARSQADTGTSVRTGQSEDFGWSAVHRIQRAAWLRS